MAGVEQRGGQPQPQQPRQPDQTQPLQGTAEGRASIQGPTTLEGAAHRGRDSTSGQQPSREGGTDYRAVLGSIRAEQDRETFVGDLRQHGEQLLSFATKLKASIRSDPTSEELRDKAALGVYLEVALKQFVLDNDPFSSNPAEYRDEDSNEPLTQAEQREMLAFWATERVALKWLDDHPGSEAANEVAGWNIYGFHDQHQRFLQEIWPEILLQGPAGVAVQKPTVLPNEKT